MFFNRKRRKSFWAFLSVVMVASNLAGSMTVSAAGTKMPEKEDKTVPEEYSSKETPSTESSYVNDTPLRLQVSKIKTAKGTHEGISPQNTDAVQEDTITYQLSGRVEGSEAELIGKYGYDQVELAYSPAGAYLGYGYFNGTLEYLSGRKAQKLDEDIELIYNEYGVFDGYAYITRKLETADDVNRYVAGARMALYDAVEIFRNPAVTRDSGHYGEDERFTGVTVIRDKGSNNVTSVYVNQGYAGTKVEYVLQKEDGTKVLIDGNGIVIDQNYQYQDTVNDTGNGVWIAKTIQREDTPILFYSLDNLQITSNDIYTGIGFQNDKLIDQVFGAERPDKKRNLYGFDKRGRVVNITQKDELDFSVFAFEAGTNRPVYEFVGGDYEKIRYSLPEKAIEVGEHTVMYHLDEDGNRDSRVDPQTGIAYIEEPIAGREGHDNLHHVNDTASSEHTKLYVWPVNIFYDGSGAAQGNGNGSRTFQKIMTTRIAAIHADTPEEYTTGTYEGDSFQKAMNPVLDTYGHPVYYRKSEETYRKGEDRYDYDGDEYLGFTYKDSLDQENEDAYRVNPHEELYNGDSDDPFNQSTHYQYSDKQTIRLTVDIEGNYIVNGARTVPVPVRAGYQFAGWLIEPDRLTDGGRAAARWRNGNSPGMEETEREQWYSSRPAVGTTRTVTVTFEANGGEFRSGSGDIHSTDNLLYRRLGDAYLMENVWTTGENTPNDPFDTQLVNTVGNAAEGTHTILKGSETGNDVYSRTGAGGQADMLKRVNTGTYIMEELISPAGYVKSLPVGVTVNEDTNLQYAEMTDRTIKAEFIKTDASDSQEKGLYMDGIRQQTDAGTGITVKEPKGSWSHRHISGAVISLKARDDSTKKAFSDWVKVTENPRIVKKEEGGFYYLEFSTDTPLFLEALPEGNYRLSEVRTLEGFITMPDQEITIGEKDGVQIYSMKDDHTKVEIEKYQNDGTGRRHLPNACRAELALTDRSGEILAVWETDDLSDYISGGGEEPFSFWQRLASVFSGDRRKKKQSFVELFTEQVNHGDTSFSRISWEVQRKAVKAPHATKEKETWIISDGSRIVCDRGSAPEDAPQEFKDAYNTRNLEEDSFTYPVTLHASKDEKASEGLSHQIWEVSNGSRMRISIHRANEDTAEGRRAYEVSFGFNYRDDYSGGYANTISYDTVEGIHRFDYLPVGTYVLKETGTPEGYVTALEQTIQVEERGDIQRFTMENKERQLSIAKVAGNGTDYYAGASQGAAVMSKDRDQAAVIPGAALSLYFSETEIADYKEAFAGGNIPEGASLADSWVSGKDGRYTEAEYKAESIRLDQVGDYRPHVVKNLRNGWYYLVETETPPYFKTFEPVSIPVTDLSDSDLSANIQAVNTPVPLKVKVFKQNEEGTPLAGAVFKVRNKTLGGISVGTLNTDETGYGTLSIMDIGRFSPEGTLEPYTFTIEEISAPSGYALNHEIHEFSASPDVHDVYTLMTNPSDAAIVNGVFYVSDQPSEITISKADFYDRQAVPGAALAVYEAEQKNGIWQSTGISKGADWRWITEKREKSHTITGLTAGGTYVLTEESYPVGYTKAKDVFFRVSPGGTSIERIRYDPKEDIAITFASDSTGAVEKVTFTTRTVLGTYVVLEDVEMGTCVSKGTLADGSIHLSPDDVEEGRRYRIREYVRYSDGSEDILGTVTFLAKLHEGWMKVDLRGDVQNLTSHITDGADTEILSFTPDDTGRYTVSNPLKEDPDGFTVIGQILRKTGVDHAAVQAGDTLYYEISYEGEGKEIIVLPADGITYLRATGGLLKQEDGTYRMVTTKKSGTMTVVAHVEEEASGYIHQQVSIDGKAYSYVNPVAVNHGDGIFKDSSKLVISSSVAGTHPENRNAPFTFKVILTAGDGSPLSGAYDYRTRYTNGTLYAYGEKSEFEISVNGNDFITIQDLPCSTSYQVLQVVAEQHPFVVTNTRADGRTGNTAVSNVLFTNTRNANSERSVFVKNTGYFLTEYLHIRNGDSLTLRKYGFSLGEKCQIKDISLLNKPTEVWFTKLDWTDSEEVEGAVCVLMDEDGNVLTDSLGNELRWISGKEPKKFAGILEAGKTYRYHEEAAPEGYGYSEDVVFTVSDDGTIDKVVMQDKPTICYFSKQDFAGTELPGAVCELGVVKGDGTRELLSRWISGTEPHRIEGILSPGKTYYYHEKEAPVNYGYSEDIVFSLDKEGIVKSACYVNEEGEPVFYDKHGYPTSVHIHTDESGTVTYEYQEKEVFLENGSIVTEQGEIIAEGVGMEIPIEKNQISMKDKPFEVTVTKEDFAGKEIPGAACELKKVNPDGTAVSVDKWISKETPHVLERGLKADSTYRYHEELAPEGYGYSEDIEFTVNRDGVVVSAHYVSKDGEPVLYDRDGYPTGIILHPDGTYTDHGHTITIDGNGNAIDENGEVHGEGVQYEIPVVGNRIAMKDAPTRLCLVKTDLEGVPVAGANFQILQENGTAVKAASDTLIPSAIHEGMIKQGEELIFLSDGTAEGVMITGQLLAGETYLMREWKPAAGYIRGGDISFQMPCKNQKEPVQVVMENRKTKVSFTKEDFAGKEIPGATCELLKVNPDGTTSAISKWISGGIPHIEEGVLNTDTTYRYHEEASPEGYGYSEDIEFTVDRNGAVTGAHYINEQGKPILFDKDGYPTRIVVHLDGTYTDGETIIQIDGKGNAVDESGEIHGEGVAYEIPVSGNVVKMKDAPTRLFIQKTGLDGKLLKGGKFQILTSEGKPVKAVSDTRLLSLAHSGTIRKGEPLIFAARTEGVEITGQLQAGKNYLLKELEAPDGHLTGEAVHFPMPYINQKEPLRVSMGNEAVKVLFTKEDFAGKEIPGAVCELLKVNPDGSVTRIDRWVSGSTPHKMEGVMDTNTTYRYREEAAPEGYGYSEMIEFTLNPEGVVINAHYINEKGEPILYDKDGFPTSIVLHPDGTYTDGEQAITIDEKGNVVDEKGEIHGEGVRYEIEIAGNVVKMKDAPTTVVIQKVSMDRKALSGGTYQILKADGTPAKAVMDCHWPEDGSLLFAKGEDLIFTANAAGTPITGQLKAGEDYFLAELKPPEGYVTGEKVKFHMPYLNQKKPLEVCMKDASTQAAVLKADKNGVPVKGAKLSVRDAANGDVMDDWVSDGTAHMLTGILTAGHQYRLVEEKAPEGYYKASDVIFTMPEDSQVMTVTMEDFPVIVTVEKVRKGSRERLQGGRFEIVRKSDQVVVVPEFVINGTITLEAKLSAGVTYLLREKKAPSGYRKMEDFEFTVPLEKKEEVISILLENEKIPTPGGGKPSSPPTVTFKKYDGITMAALPGAEFTIYRENGTVYERVTTDSAGYAYVTFDSPGSYTYQETKAPAGYQADPNRYELKITAASHKSIPAANYHTPPNVTIKKADSETGEPVEGVRFEIWDETGQVVYKGTTDSYGQITFIPDRYGAFAVRETKVPEAYTKSEGYLTFTVRAGGIEGETVFYNAKKDRTLPPDPGKRAGMIHAVYDNGADGYGNGWFDRDGTWHPFATPSKTGDVFPFAVLGLIMCCGMIGLAIIRKKRGGEGHA